MNFANAFSNGAVARDAMMSLGTPAAAAATQGATMMAKVPSTTYDEFMIEIANNNMSEPAEFHDPTVTSDDHVIFNVDELLRLATGTFKAIYNNGNGREQVIQNQTTQINNLNTQVQNQALDINNLNASNNNNLVQLEERKKETRGLKRDIRQLQHSADEAGIIWKGEESKRRKLREEKNAAVSEVKELKRQLAEKTRENNQLKKDLKLAKSDAETVDSFCNALLALLFHMLRLTEEQGKIFLYIYCRHFMLEDVTNIARGVDTDISHNLYPFFKKANALPNSAANLRYAELETNFQIIVGHGRLVAGHEHQDWMAIKSAILETFPNVV